MQYLYNCLLTRDQCLVEVQVRFTARDGKKLPRPVSLSTRKHGGLRIGWIKAGISDGLLKENNRNKVFQSFALQCEEMSMPSWKTRTEVCSWCLCRSML